MNGIHMKHMSWPAVAEYLKKSQELIIPFSAIEEHGPHLPLTVDTDIIEGMVSRASEATGIMVYPTFEWGICNATSTYTGTFTSQFGPYKHFVMQIFTNAYNHGFRTFYLTTGHLGGECVNAFLLAAKHFMKLHEECKIYYIDPYKHATEKLFIDGDGHAGMLETSLMLYLCPNKVDMEKAVDEKMEFHEYVVTGSLKKTKSGIWGPATQATVQLGEKALASMVAGFTQAIEKIRKNK